jgi:ABC-2 type transport system permease protein
MGPSVRDPAGIFRVVGALLRVSLMTAMQYRSNFLLNGFTGIFGAVGTVAPLYLVFLHTDAIGDWSFPEATLVMAFFLLLNAFHGGIMEPNLGAVVEQVRQGSFDLVLLKPTDTQLLVSLSRVDPAHVWDLVAAAILGGWGLAHLPALPGSIDLLAAVVFLFAGLAAMYGIWIFAICASFFFIQVDNLRYLLMSVSETGRWPVTVFAGWVRILLTVVVPVGIITTFPAMALRGTWTVENLGIAFATATVFLVASRLAWRRSLAAYTSASS